MTDELGLEPGSVALVQAALAVRRLREATVGVARVRSDGDAATVAAAEAELAAAEDAVQAVLPVLARLSSRS